jgi:hypothetical protein
VTEALQRKLRESALCPPMHIARGHMTMTYSPCAPPVITEPLVCVYSPTVRVSARKKLRLAQGQEKSKNTVR